MKILCIIDSLGSGGAQRQIVTLAQLFIEHGYVVEFLVYHDAGFFKPLLLEKGIKINHIVSKSNIDKIIKIRKFIRYNNNDIVVSFLDTPNFLACIAAIGGKSWKLIISERSGNKQRFNKRKHRIYRWFYRFADAIVCNSERSKQMWFEFCPQYIKKIITIYNTVHLQDISTEYIPKRDHKLHIVITASYQYLKNPIGLVKALCLLNENEREKIKIDWYGSNNISSYGTKIYDEALKLITENNLTTIINLNGETHNSSNIMNQADIIGLFSEYEGLPNAICEGMMIGKPIIMSRVSDYDVLVDNKNGCLCEWDNPQSISDAFSTMINKSESDLQIMGQESIKKAKELFDKEKIMKQWGELFVTNCV